MQNPATNTASNTKIQYILKGFTEATGFRVFAFEAVAPDRTRTAFTVRTDLALTRKYRIRLQELPLLCRAVLERSHEGEEATVAFTYTEDDMCLFAESAAARAEAAKLKKPGKAMNANPAVDWRPAPPQPSTAEPAETGYKLVS